jgi:hypothetical protein
MAQSDKWFNNTVDDELYLLIVAKVYKGNVFKTKGTTLSEQNLRVVFHRRRAPFAFFEQVGEAR